MPLSPLGDACNPRFWRRSPFRHTAATKRKRKKKKSSSSVTVDALIIYREIWPSLHVLIPTSGRSLAFCKRPKSAQTSSSFLRAKPSPPAHLLLHCHSAARLSHVNMHTHKCSASTNKHIKTLPSCFILSSSYFYRAVGF